MTRKVRPPAVVLGCDEEKSEGDLIRQWMNNLDWSMVLCADLSCVRRGSTRETREEALEEADAVCSVSTVVLCAMQALEG